MKSIILPGFKKKLTNFTQYLYMLILTVEAKLYMKQICPNKKVYKFMLYPVNLKIFSICYYISGMSNYFWNRFISFVNRKLRINLNVQFPYDCTNTQILGKGLWMALIKEGRVCWTHFLPPIGWFFLPSRNKYVCIIIFKHCVLLIYMKTVKVEFIIKS